MPPEGPRYSVSKTNPRSCMKKSVRYAPMRRAQKRAAKSAAPQQIADINPSKMGRDMLPKKPVLAPLLRLEAEGGHHLPQIPPDFALGVRIAQKIGGMVSGHKFRAEIIEPLAAETRYSLIRSEQRLCRACPQAANHLGLNDSELANEKWRTSVDFIALGQTILGRAALHHIADVNVLAAQSHGFDHLGQKLSCATDEGFSLHVFVMPGAFANEDKLRLRIADPKHDVCPALVEFAARAIADVFADAFE